MRQTSPAAAVLLSACFLCAACASTPKPAAKSVAQRNQEILNNALLNAAQNGQADTVKELLDAGAQLSAQNAQGETAATLARKYTHPELAAQLEEAAKPKVAPAQQ